VLAHWDGDILFNAAELLNFVATGSDMRAYDHPAASLAYRGASRVLCAGSSVGNAALRETNSVQPP